LNGLVGNLSGRSIPSEILNVYAFARFAKDPSATPAEVIRDFAGILANDSSAAALARVLAFVENHSSWHASVPTTWRMPDLKTDGLNSPIDALAVLQKVTARERSPIPLPVTPAQYITRLGDRLKTPASSPAP
jgi:hypothetical protein